MLRCQENSPNTSMTDEPCESKLHSVIRLSIHPCQGNWVATGHTVVYFARAAQAFSAGIKCRHCISYHITVPAFNLFTKCYIQDQALDCHLPPTSQLNAALIRKLCGSLLCAWCVFGISNPVIKLF